MPNRDSTAARVTTRLDVHITPAALHLEAMAPMIEGPQAAVYQKHRISFPLLGFY